MKSVLRIIFPVFLFLLVLPAGTYAAGDGFAVRGQVVDSLTLQGEPMAYVTLESGDYTAGGAADIDGYFELKAGPAGTYVLKVVSTGRKPYSRTVSVNSDTDLGKILLQDDKQQLDAAVVAAQVPFVKTEVDRLTYDVNSDPESTTSTALDMLRKVPRVTVDGDDNIRVNGQGNFKIYVNGRPSGLFSNNPSQILKSLPAESIKKIEVISDPGAKYDAEGTGGILNIVMNTRRSDGYNLNLNASSAMYADGKFGWNGGLYGAVKLGKFTVSANYGYYDHRSPASYMDMSTDSYDAEGNLVKSVDNSTSFTGAYPMHFGSLEMSYEIDSLNLLTLSGNLFMMDGTNSSTSSYNVYGAGDSFLYGYVQNGFSRNRMNNSSANVDYQHTFRSSGTLTLSYRLGLNPNYTSSGYVLDSLRGDTGLMPQQYVYSDNVNDVRASEHTFQADISLPFAGKHRVEAGLKYIGRFGYNDGISKVRNDEGQDWTENPLSPSLEYSHAQHIAAIYADYSYTAGQFGLKAGVRGEQTFQTLAYVGQDSGNDVNASFTDVVPNLSVMWMKDPTETLQLTYNMRIMRPGITQLSPYRFYQSSGDVSYGNPDLVSEKSHTLSLNYSKFAAKYGANASLRYTFTGNSITSYSFMDSEGVLNTTSANAGKAHAAGLSVYAYWNPSVNTRLFLNGDLAYSVYDGGEDNVYLKSLRSEGFSGSVFAGAQQTFRYGFRLSANGGYFHSGVTLQGRSGGSYFYSLSLNKSFLDSKLNVSFSASSFLNRYLVYRSVNDTPYMKSESVFRYPAMSFRLGISYTIGNMGQTVKKVRRSIVNDDLMKSSSGAPGSGQQGMER